MPSTTAPSPDCPILLAGYPDRYPDVYHAVRVLMGDMTVVINQGDSTPKTIMVRNIEVPRVQRQNPSAIVTCPEEHAPSAGLDSNRNIGFAQATAQLFKQENVHCVVSNQMLPLIFVDLLNEAGIEVICDRQLGILDRRAKDDWEIKQLTAAQSATEDAIRFAYEIIRDADVSDDDTKTLIHEDQPLTSERLRSEITLFLLKRGYANDDSIVAPGSLGADCHNAGSGPLRLNAPIIIDVFPTSKSSRYSGDCTRTLCRGEISPILRKMYEIVREAKSASIAASKAGATGADVHAATVNIFKSNGYHIGMPPANAPDDLIYYPHGTGHGVGLETHEPPILDEKNCEPLVAGDALTIEPGLYCKAIGGIRLEDMVIVEQSGCKNLNHLPESLWWD